jgi:hypothetical protein
MSLDVNNNNFVTIVILEIGVLILIETLLMILEWNHHEENGVAPKRIYDPTIEKETAWEQVLGINLNADISTKLAAYPQQWTDVDFNANNRNATNQYGNAYQTG